MDSEVCFDAGCFFLAGARVGLFVIIIRLSTVEATSIREKWHLSWEMLDSPYIAVCKGYRGGG